VAAKNGDLDVAQEAFQKAADLAAKTGQAEMEVTARIRLGDVLQQLAVPPE
jgi:hypothetical protein